MEAIIEHAEELIYKIEESVESVMKNGVDSEFKDKMLGLTSRLRSVIRNARF